MTGAGGGWGSIKVWREAAHMAASLTPLQNCFLNCLPPKEVASTIDSHIDEIEMEVLHASSASEFSHSLNPTETSADQLSRPVACHFSLAAHSQSARL